jgi:hypothetical protein
VGNTKATGGNLGDFFLGSYGNETFSGGGGGDLFEFSEGVTSGKSLGNDKIVGYNAAEGEYISFSWDAYGSYTDPMNISVVERNGHTIFTSSTLNGAVFHTLDVDAVGVNYIEGWIWT